MHEGKGGCSVEFGLGCIGNFLSKSNSLLLKKKQRDSALRGPDWASEHLTKAPFLWRAKTFLHVTPAPFFQSPNNYFQ